MDEKDKPPQLSSLTPKKRFTLVKFLIERFGIKLCEHLIVELIQNDDYKTLRQLFSHNIISPKEMVFNEEKGINPILHMAIFYGSNETVKEILKHGVPLETKNTKGLTALDVAEWSKNKEIISLLS
jgi:ankyrin repeat protein